MMTLAANLRPVAFSVQVQTAPNLPLERDEAGGEGLRGQGLRGPVLWAHLDPHRERGALVPASPYSFLKLYFWDNGRTTQTVGTGRAG